MRLWTLHPRYLDAKGLVAAWREGLLAKKVLEGKTVGYRNHPQLDRFRVSKNPVAAIDAYLGQLLRESIARGYRFDAGKIPAGRVSLERIKTGSGQLEYEWKLLLSKLGRRDLAAYEAIRHTAEIEANPVFEIVDGGVEAWERVRDMLL